MNRIELPASELIAEFIKVRLKASLPEDALHLGRRALLDTLAGAIAASNEEATNIAIRYARSTTGNALGTIWTAGERTTIEMAALANGVAAHVLDYDDVTSPMRGHPSVVLFPALAALAEFKGCSARETMNAFATGLEVIAKIGRVVAIDHVARGWHSTYTLGVIGATAACSHLLRMSTKQTAWALGIAVAQAAGTRANFGTMTKSFQAGQAAAAAIRAVTLARLGLTASPTALDGPSGFTSLYCSGESIASELAGLGPELTETLQSGLDVKRFPNCYATHRTVDAVLTLRQRNHLSIDDIARVDVVTSARAQAPLVYSRPKNGLEGKFSMEYAVAAALADGTITLDSFTDDMVQRAQIQAFMPRVNRIEASGPALPRWAEVVLHLRSGGNLMCRVETLRGSAAEPLSDDEIVAKLRTCCAYAGNTSNADNMAEIILAMDEEPFGNALRKSLGLNVS